MIALRRTSTVLYIRVRGRNILGVGWPVRGNGVSRGAHKWVGRVPEGCKQSSSRDRIQSLDLP